LLAAGVEGLEAAGGMRREVRLVVVERELVLHDEPHPSLLLAVLLRAEKRW
jgi:hypothetical protein